MWGLKHRAGGHGKVDLHEWLWAKLNLGITALEIVIWGGKLWVLWSKILFYDYMSVEP